MTPLASPQCHTSLSTFPGVTDVRHVTNCCEDKASFFLPLGVLADTVASWDPSEVALCN